MPDHPPSAAILARLQAVRAQMRHLTTNLNNLATMAPALPPNVTHTALRALITDLETWLHEQLALWTVDDAEAQQGHVEGRI